MDVEVLGDVTVVRLPARVDTTSAKDVEAELDALLDGGARKLVADFDANEYVSSAGLRVFLAVLKFLEKNDGRIVLCAMKPFVADVFDISGFSELFEIDGSREEALARYA
jgi:anti-anti-sigma factor